jgi:metallo-beta-lactamase family protein
LINGASSSRNTILIVGFQAEHTLGRRIVERRRIIRVLGNDIELRAAVEIINGYSAHADRTELVNWIDAVHRTSPGLRHVFLVHGEAAAQKALSDSLESRGLHVSCPGFHDVRSL